MPRSLFIALASAALALASFARPAHAQSVRDEIQSIRDLVFNAQFDRAVTSARALLDRPDLDATSRNATLEVLAIAQLANRQRTDAAQTLTLLYSRDPQHRLSDPDASPPVLSAFARARESAPTQVPVTIEHGPPTLNGREPPLLTASLSQGADAVSEIRLVYRAGGEDARVVMTRRPDGTFGARVPVLGDPAQPTPVLYYLVALAPSLTPLARAGTEAEPLRFEIPAAGATGAVTSGPDLGDGTPSDAPPGGGSVAEEWWFWTLIALVVVGGAVTLGIVLGPLQDGPEAGTLGVVRLMQVEL